MDFPSNSGELATPHANKGDVPSALRRENESCITMRPRSTSLILINSLESKYTEVVLCKTRGGVKPFNASTKDNALIRRECWWVLIIRNGGIMLKHSLSHN